ncbi:two-component system NtrC family sensor kinase [Bradyrhizobium sp. AZCC 1588]
MAMLPENRSVAIDELESAITEMESRLESARAERNEAKARQVELEIENANLRRELNLAREQQKASAGILSVISSSVADTKPVFESILSSIKHLFDSEESLIFLASEEGLLQITAARGANAEAARERFPIPVEGTASELAIRERRLVRSADVQNDPDVPIDLRETARSIGQNYSMAIAPMLWKDQAIGTIFVGRTSMVPFTDRECELLNSFADQAVIAIQNARLVNDAREALERQTATADILKVIASSPSDVQPVFDAIAASAKRLLGGFSTTVLRFIGDELHLVAYTPINPEADEALKSSFPRPLAEFPTFALVRNGETIQFPDTEAEAVPPKNRELARLRGFRSVLFAPLMNQGSPVGIISVTRAEPGAFAPHHVQLLQTFADQAVIAIENTRLFNETQEALERQTATADILKVIASSPSDVQPVFDAIADSANRLIGGFSAAVFRYIDGKIHLAAYTPTDAVGDAVLQASFPAPLDKFPPYHLTREGAPAELPDTEREPAARDIARARGYRSMLFAPLMNDGEPAGIITVTRVAPGPFGEQHTRLLQMFADQAVIAIKNVGLFDEVQAKTRDLEEALTYQTGSANILKVIASSPTDVGPTLNAIVESACELCDANDAVVYLKEGDHLSYKAHHGPIPVIFGEKRAINRSYVAGRSVIDKEPVHVGDVFSQEGAEFPEARELSHSEGIRSILSAPMLRENESIGAILLRRTEVHPFTDKQIALLQTFADQAVIAIGNVRLFEQVQERTRELSEALTYQTGSANILRVIAASPTDVKPVLRAIVESACELCGAYDATVRLRNGDSLDLGSHHGPISVNPQTWPISRNWTAGLAVIEKKPIHIHDYLSAEGDAFPEGQESARRHGHRTILSVPMLREGEAIGAIILRRTEVNPFTDKQIALLQTFADQAVIAIGNVRLFEQVQERTRELSKSLDDLRTAQDRLVQTEKLASLGQLTAGIAHEIKNPLNFVNNFAAVSTELTEELNDALKQAEVGEKIRAEVDELTGLLMGNLEKIVQHGRRADSIVKNMLLHSREGGGEHRPSDINALVDESLNLAYHGARAEKPGFNVTLERDFDPAAGRVDLFPQEITRVLLNLVSNGFYAVTKRSKEAGEPGFEPTLRASTKNLGDAVEIRIRDNGAGISPDVREKMFDPFFTTKPAGEGTGLGLSMSHDIIAKQHGGTIDVNTEQGHFTEFRIVLPRTSNFAEKSRG